MRLRGRRTLRRNIGMQPDISPQRSRSLLRFGCRFSRRTFPQVEWEFPLRPAKTVVRPDDPLHKVMTNHVAIFKMAETNAIHAAENLNGLHQPALLGVG